MRRRERIIENTGVECLSFVIKEYHQAHIRLNLPYIWLDCISVVNNTYEKNLESVLFAPLYGEILAARSFCCIAIKNNKLLNISFFSFKARSNSFNNKQLSH